MSESSREFDIVVWGATGFTGGLVAHYLDSVAPKNLRWAIAGRNEAKLDARLAELSKPVPKILADAGDPESLHEMSRRTRVLLTTVGPYAKYGMPLVESCIATSTDYVDITGEPDFVAETLKHHEAAKAAGVRIVSCCGFDSIPHDLGAWCAVSALPGRAPIRLEGFVRAKGTISGGTWQSFIGAVSDLKGTQAKARSAPKQKLDGRKVRSLPPRPRYETRLQSWVVPFPTIDPEIVKRSARSLDVYGPDFQYGHYLSLKRFSTLAKGAAGLAGITALAQLPPGKDYLEKRILSGDGPDASTRAKSWFHVAMLGRSGGDRVRVDVRGGDPGYSETSKMVAETALCLAFDLPREEATQLGVITTATACAEPLVARLRKAGIRFDVSQPTRAR